MRKEAHDPGSPPQNPGDALVFNDGVSGCVIATWSGTVEYEKPNGRGTLRGERLERLVEVQQGRWIEQSDEQFQAFKRERAQHIQQYNAKLGQDFLQAESYLGSIAISPPIVRALVDRKIEYIRSWVAEYSSDVPDREQAEAIGTINGDVLVTARAGSGKTATLVNRALFLMRQCRVPPQRILLLAFNKKAALQIRQKLLAAIDAEAYSRVEATAKAKLAESKRRRIRLNPVDVGTRALDAEIGKANIALPHAMTFHALAYRIVHPTEELLYDETEGRQAQSRAVQEIIDDWLASHERHTRIRDVMLEHFRRDWNAIIKGGFDRDRESFLAYRRSIVNETLNGEYVKSFGEKVIADFLFEHDIQYRYERNFRWDDFNYKPDFSIFPKKAEHPQDKHFRQIIAEYFGLAGDPDYDEMSEKKRAFWRGRNDVAFIEYSARDFAGSGREGLCAKIKADLEALGVPCTRLSENEIWERARDRVVDGFSKAVRGFISRCRKLGLTVEELDSLIVRHSHAYETERKFYEVASGIYSDYLARLENSGEEDFDGLILRAVEVIKSGQTNFHSKVGGGDLAALEHISVDEYQDFSELFFRLLTSIREKNKRVNLFCVGDDWQAINTFAGSDLKFFRDFEDYVPGSSRLRITKNYRSCMDIVSAGNAVMRGCGVPSQAASDQAGSIGVADIAEFSPTEAESNRFQGDDITPAVLRLVYRALTMGEEVAVLARRNGLPYYFVTRSEARSSGLPAFENSLRSAFSSEDRHKIEVSTTHSYKGLEKERIIVVDAVDRSYPLIHPNWVFSRLFGDSLDEVVSGERRLFYVAITRAISNLVIVTDGNRPSRFLEELLERSELERLCWEDYEPVPTGSEVHHIRLRGKPGSAGTYGVKDQIKACGYRWSAGGNQCWSKAVSATSLDLDRMKHEPWCEEADTVQVIIEKENGEIIDRYEVQRGRWTNLTR